MKVFDVDGVPGERLLGCVSVLEVPARIKALLERLATSVESEASIHVDCSVDAQVVTRSNKHCPRVVSRIFELFLYLRKLTVRPRCVNNLWQFDANFSPDQFLPF